MRVLRENKESVMAVLEAFVHDPLINWKLTRKDRATARLPEDQGKCLSICACARLFSKIPAVVLTQSTFIVPLATGGGEGGGNEKGEKQEAREAEMMDPRVSAMDLDATDEVTSRLDEGIVEAADQRQEARERHDGDVIALGGEEDGEDGEDGPNYQPEANQRAVQVITRVSNKLTGKLRVKRTALVS